MKFSIFNSEIQFTQNLWLLYNSLHDKFIFHQSPILQKEIDDLRTLNIWHRLIDNGFIINDNCCEYDIVKKIREEIDLTESESHIIVNSTLNCNFNCWYCYESHVRDSGMNDYNIVKTKKLIHNTIQNVKTLALSFFGGEPLLKYKSVVSPLAKYAYEECLKYNVNFSCAFTSNGYLLTEDIILDLKQYNVDLFQITFDGYRIDHNATKSTIDGKGSYDKTLNNIKLLLNNEIRVILRINYTDKNISNLRSIITDLTDLTLKSKKFLRVCFQKVWQINVDLESEIQEIISEFNSAGILSTTAIFNNLRQSCYGDKKNSVVVNYNGDIFKCTTEDFSEKQRDGYVDEDGNLVWENDSLNKRLNAKFKSKPCLSCRILPLCNGGCSQRAIESNGNDYCILGLDNKKIDNVILDRVRYNILYNPAWKSYILKA